MADTLVEPGLLPTTQELINDHVTPQLEHVLHFLAQSSNNVDGRQAALDRILFVHLKTLSNAFEREVLANINARTVESFLQDIKGGLFNNTISSTISFRWIHDLRVHGTGTKSRGQHQRLLDGKHSIHVDPLPFSPMALFDTCVHEMCHALVSELRCLGSCPDGEDRSYYCDAFSNKLTGTGGHGYRWQRSTRAVEEESLRLFSLQLNVSRALSAFFGFKYRGGTAPDLAYTEQVFDHKQRASLHSLVVDNRVDQAIVHFMWTLEASPNLRRVGGSQALASINSGHLPNLQSAFDNNPVHEISLEEMSHLMRQLTCLICPSMLECHRGGRRYYRPIIFHWNTCMYTCSQKIHGQTSRDRLGRRVYEVSPNREDVSDLLETLLRLLCTAIYEFVSGHELKKEEWAVGWARLLRITGAVERNSVSLIGMQADLKRVEAAVDIWARSGTWPDPSWYEGVFDKDERRRFAGLMTERAEETERENDEI